MSNHVEEKEMPGSGALGQEESAPPRRTVFRQDLTGGVRATIILACSSLGIIYGDLGTSPLYVFNAIFPVDGAVPSEEDIIGACSCIIWALTIVPLVKYSIIALCFGNGTGEGGPFALYTALYPPPEETDDNRALTTYTTASVKTRMGSILDLKWVQAVLFGWVLFGTTLTMSDGLLTPAVSVVSAVQGLAVGVPSVGNSVIGISIAILVCLFALQILGTRRVAFVFSPVICLWLLTIAISGVINVVQHPGVFRAFDPSRAILLFVRTKNFDLLSGVLLCLTGCEALFANLGQFSKHSIRLGFIGFVYPCLLLAYLGQAARLVVDPVNVLPNVFFQSIPGPTGGGFWWFTFVIGILAAVIASQAMISATFSLVHQLVRLHSMPAVKILHSSDAIEGQIFIPAVNLLVAAGTIGVTAGLGSVNSGAALTNAYGFAVAGVFIVTTSFLAIAIIRLKHLPVYVAALFFVAFVFVDSLFFGASLKKVPEGAWFPLGLAVILGLFFLFWSWAQGLENKFDAEHRYRLNEVISRPTKNEGGDDEPSSESEADETYQVHPAETFALGHQGGHNEVVGETITTNTLRKRNTVLGGHTSGELKYNSPLQLTKGGTKLERIPIFALFHNSSANTLNGAPHSFSAFLKCYPSLPQVAVFFNIRVVGIPHTIEEERIVVSRVRSFEGVYIATLRLGYRDPVDLSRVAFPIREAIVAIERKSNPHDAVERIRLVDEAMERAVTHILPHFHVSAVQTGNKFVRFIRTFLIASMYKRMKVNFDETSGFDFGDSEENVLRMGVSAAL